MAQNELARGLESAIEKDRAEQRLEGVGQRGGPLAAAVQFLAAAEDQMLPEAQFAALLGQRAAIDEFGAGLGQRAFAEGGKFFVQLARQHELQNGVAEEFQPLIRLHRRALLVRDRGMGQREPQQFQVAEDVAQPVLQFLVFGHGGHL